MSPIHPKPGESELSATPSGISCWCLAESAAGQSRAIAYLLPHLGWIAARAHTGWIGPNGPPRKIGKKYTFFYFSGPLTKKAWDGPKWGQEDFSY